MYKVQICNPYIADTWTCYFVPQSFETKRQAQQYIDQQYGKTKLNRTKIEIVKG